MQHTMTAASRYTNRRGHVRALENGAEPAGGPSETELTRHYRMTPREAQVALLLALRCSNKEIASRLGIACDTASHHTGMVLAKLGLSSRREVRDRLAVRDMFRPMFFGQMEGLLQ